MAEHVLSMMNNAQNLLATQIPITDHMNLDIECVSENEFAIRAPLAPNRNDKGTGFAGSLYSAMVLAGWCFVSTKLKADGLDAQVAVTSSHVDFLHPVTDDFSAVCRLSDPDQWVHFVSKLEKRRNYHISLSVDLICAGDVKATLTGQYIAWFPRKDW